MVMDAVVTGGSGFVGANVVRELLRAGQTVRVLVRPHSNRDALQGCRVELTEGDILEIGSLRKAMAGCRVVYHVAADYRLWVPDPPALYRTNVEGTRHVLTAAAEAGVGRVVYTSTVGALGIPPDGSPGTETTPVTLDDMVGHYKRSKYLAERVAEEFALRGLPVVIVNPSAPVGPWDIKPTPTGKMIVDFLRGKMFAYLATGLNLVHVRDVAQGHLLAAERGRVGEKYILGNRNCALVEIFQMLSRMTGLPAPKLRVPYALAWLGAAVGEGWARLRGKTPEVPLTAVRMAAKRMFFNSEKAVRELGLPQTPVEEALREAVEWFASRGFASLTLKKGDAIIASVAGATNAGATTDGDGRP
jgi:dihydroflavonol-4-reductase